MHSCKLITNLRAKKVLCHHVEVARITSVMGKWGPPKMGTPSVADHFLGSQSSFPLTITD